MAGFTSYSIANDKAFNEALTRARGAANDLRIPFNLIAIDFYRSQKAIFNLKSAGQYPDFGGFNPNALAGRIRGQDVNRKALYSFRKKQAVGFDYPLLVGKSRKLKTAASQMGGAGNITIVSKTSLAMGVNDSTVPYAKYHQSDKKRTVMPQRKLLFIGPESHFANNEQKGRLNRWMQILSTNVPAKMRKESGFGK